MLNKPTFLSLSLTLLCSSSLTTLVALGLVPLYGRLIFVKAKKNTAAQKWSHMYWVEGKNCLPGPAGYCNLLSRQLLLHGCPADLFNLQMFILYICHLFTQLEQKKHREKTYQYTYGTGIKHTISMNKLLMSHNHTRWKNLRRVTITQLAVLTASLEVLFPVIFKK